MPQISTGKMREWSIFKGDNQSDKNDNSGYCPVCEPMLVAHTTLLESHAAAQILLVKSVKCTKTSPAPIVCFLQKHTFNLTLS